MLRPFRGKPRAKSETQYKINRIVDPLRCGGAARTRPKRRRPSDLREAARVAPAPRGFAGTRVAIRRAIERGLSRTDRAAKLWVVSQRDVHDDGEAPRQRDPRFGMVDLVTIARAF